MHVETLSIRISKSERAALRAAARREKISQGQIVRKALLAYGIKPRRKHPSRLRPGEGFDREKQRRPWRSLHQSEIHGRLRPVKSWIADTGPLIALLEEAEKYHAWTVDACAARRNPCSPAKPC